MKQPGALFSRVFLRPCDSFLYCLLRIFRNKEMNIIYIKYFFVSPQNYYLQYVVQQFQIDDDGCVDVFDQFLKL